MGEGCIVPGEVRGRGLYSTRRRDKRGLHNIWRSDGERVV